MNNTKEKAQPGSATYIETIYGTKTFARALMLDDAQSIMDLMDDYADHANKPYQSRISDLESILAGNTNYEQQLALESRISQLESDLAAYKNLLINIQTLTVNDEFNYHKDIYEMIEDHYKALKS